MVKVRYDGLRDTHIGCFIDDPNQTNLYGSIKHVYYECSTTDEAFKQAYALLESVYEVTVVSNGLYNVRSYHSRRELMKDYKLFLEGM